MLNADLGRMKEYVDRIGQTPDLSLAVLTLEERQELELFLLMRIAELEFGYPIYGEN